MKIYVLLLPLALLTGCTSKKPIMSTSIEKASLVSPCPEGGTCKLTYLKNKRIELKTNEATGKYYHVIADSETKNVVQYEYTLDTDPTLADAGHTEVVLFEVDAENPETEVSGTALQKTNMIFGRFCFCRGATGIYKVTDGKLSVKSEDNTLNVKLDFKVTEVPQIIDTFSGVIK